MKKRVIETCDIGRMAMIYPAIAGMAPFVGLVIGVDNSYRLRTGPDTEIRLGFGHIAAAKFGDDQ